MSEPEEIKDNIGDKNGQITELSEEELIIDGSEQNSLSSKQSLAESNCEIKSNDITSQKIEYDFIDEFKEVKEIRDITSKIDEKLLTDKEEKQLPCAENDLPFSVIHKQKVFQKLMNLAKQRSEQIKSKLISQLSEIFRMFDINHDGIIDENDLRFTFTSLGETNISDEKIKNMINESPKPIDFNAFVGLFESKEMEFDSETDLITAFSKWDTKSNGFMLEESLKQDLQSWGDRFSEKDATYALEEAPLYEEDGKSTIDYIEFCANFCGLQNIRKSELFNEKVSK